jgi:hypothetical protein
MVHIYSFIKNKNIFEITYALSEGCKEIGLEATDA